MLTVFYLRVSNIVKEFPRDNVLDSWNVIFPGMSMSNKCICKNKKRVETDFFPVLSEALINAGVQVWVVVSVSVYLKSPNMCWCFLNGADTSVADPGFSRVKLL